MSFQLLVDSGEFWTSLEADIRQARGCVYIQTLSFEGDRVGKMLSETMLSSPARDRRLIVDCYTKYILSDRFLYTPGNLLNRELRQEAKDTKQTVRDLEAGGVRVKFANPVGPMLVSFPARNHKKILVIDDKVAYIGGINFSEHNFEWHDLMLRIEDEAIAQFLRQDFLASWENKNQSVRQPFQDIEFYLFDGYANPATCQGIFQIIDSARDRIFIQTPYLSFPYYEKFRQAKDRGVAITFVAPGANNWKIYQDYTFWQASRSGIDLKLYKDGMTHLKAMLIDDRYLILGSSNFDCLSYYLQQELMAVVTNASIIAEFEKRVIDEDLKNSCSPSGQQSEWLGRLCAVELTTFCNLFRVLNGRR